MTWKPALIRALRSFLQGCVTAITAFLLYLGSQSAWAWVDVKVEGSKLAMGLGLAAGYGVVSFIQNFLEDNFDEGGRVPKG